MAGNPEQTKKSAKHMYTAGSVHDNTPFGDAISAGAGTLRNGLYIVEDLIIDDPDALGYGIGVESRGCWVCDYLRAGIIITLLYGAIVLIYRAARHGRNDEGSDSSKEAAPSAS